SSSPPMRRATSTVRRSSSTAARPSNEPSKSGSDPDFFPRASPMNKPVVGMIGVGAMGAPMAKRILAAGYPVAGYDINPQAQSALKEMKGESLGSAGEVAKRADIILIVLVDDP